MPSIITLLSHRRDVRSPPACAGRFRSVYKGDCPRQHTLESKVPIWPLTWRKRNPPRTHTKTSHAIPHPRCSTRITSLIRATLRRWYQMESETIIECRLSTGETVYQTEARPFRRALNFMAQTMDLETLDLLVEAPSTAQGARQTQRVCCPKSLPLK